MKLNLLLDNAGDVRSGYTNIDPFAPEDDPKRITGDVNNLNLICDAGEATEIVAHQVLDYFYGEAVDEAIDNWVSKLAHGGQLTVSMVDLKEVSRGLVGGNLNIDQAHELIYGKQEAPWQFRKSGFTLRRLVEALESRGLKVLQKRCHNYVACTTAVRP